jgi:hypothetical protein
LEIRTPNSIRDKFLKLKRLPIPSRKKKIKEQLWKLLNNLQLYLDINQKEKLKK